MLLIHKKLVNLLTNKKYYLYYNYYSRSIAKYKDIDSYLSVFEKRSFKKGSIQSSEEIVYDSEIKFGSSISEVKRKIRAPYTVISTSGLSSVLFYKMKIGTYKVFVEMHFFEGKLFFFKYLFPSLENESFMKNGIKNKYLNSLSEVDFTQQNIQDQFGNYLIVEKEVFLSVYYFSLNFGFYEHIKRMEYLRRYNVKRKKEVEMFELIQKL